MDGVERCASCIPVALLDCSERHRILQSRRRERLRQTKLYRRDQLLFRLQLLVQRSANAFSRVSHALLARALTLRVLPRHETENNAGLVVSMRPGNRLSTALPTISWVDWPQPSNSSVSVSCLLNLCVLIFIIEFRPTSSRHRRRHDRLRRSRRSGPLHSEPTTCLD